MFFSARDHAWQIIHKIYFAENCDAFFWVICRQILCDRKIINRAKLPSDGKHKYWYSNRINFLLAGEEIWERRNYQINRKISLVESFLKRYLLFNISWKEKLREQQHKKLWLWKDVSRRGLGTKKTETLSEEHIFPNVFLGRKRKYVLAASCFSFVIKKLFWTSSIFI